MGRGKRGFLNELARLPWPVGLVAGAVGFLIIAQGIPWWLSSRGGILAQAFSHQSSLAIPFACFFFVACTFASLASYLDMRRKRQLHDTLHNLEQLASLGWREFEQLVGEAFRRQGYIVEETGLGGADGGVDLILCRDGRRVLVQCKQWRRERVPVNVVREMYGLLAHHQADEVQIVAMTGFTPDAARFSEGKPIVLLCGQALLDRVRAIRQLQPQRRLEPGAAEPVPHSIESAAHVPNCPRCAIPMVRRQNRQSGQKFWGCSKYPHCRETRPA